MRRVILVGLLCVACTRDNPAFDDRPLADGGTSEHGDGDGGDGDGDGDASTTANTSDLPPDPPACEFQPADGLALRVGAPENFGGMCDVTGVNMGGRIVSMIGSQLMVETCSPGCLQCYDGMFTISTFPLTLDGHVPMTPGKCISIEAHGSLGAQPDGCYFGALTIYEPDPLTPYVIATAHSWEPTAMGLMMLAGSVPAPAKGANCNCDDVGQGNDCCYMAPTPPEFWYYPIDGEKVFQGDYAPLVVPNQLGLAHAFKLFQAQALHSCESPDLQLSWAVVAEL